MVKHTLVYVCGETTSVLDPKTRNSVIDPPLLGASKCRTVLHGSLSSRFVIVLAQQSPQKWSNIRPFSIHVVPYCRLWRGDHHQAHLGPGP